MVDAVLSKLSEFKQRTDKAAALPRNVNLQTGSFHYVKGSSKLVVILPYWHAQPSRFASYRSRLHAKGVSTLYYDTEPHMLQAHVQQVVQNFTESANQIIDEIQSFQAAFGLTRLGIDAFSLGNTFAGLLVSKLEGIETLRMVVPGDNLATCMWEGIATKHIRTSLEAQGVSLPELVDAWQDLAPAAYASIIAANVPDVYVTLAKADKFIPYNRGQLLVEAFTKAGVNLHLRVWRVGHGAAVLRYIRLNSGQSRPKEPDLTTENI